mgnify:CR=1 FL=1
MASLLAVKMPFALKVAGSALMAGAMIVCALYRKQPTAVSVNIFLYIISFFDY